MSDKLICRFSIDELQDLVKKWSPDLDEDDLEVLLKKSRCVESHKASWDDSDKSSPLTKLLIKSLYIRAANALYPDALSAVPEQDLYFAKGGKWIVCLNGKQAYEAHRKLDRDLCCMSMWDDVKSGEAAMALRENENTYETCQAIHFGVYGWQELMDRFNDPALGREFETAHGTAVAIFHKDGQTASISPYIVSTRVDDVLGCADSVTIVTEIFKDVENGYNVFCGKNALAEFVTKMGAKDFTIQTEYGEPKYILKESHTFRNSLHQYGEEIVRYSVTLPIPKCNSTSKN